MEVEYKGISMKGGKLFIIFSLLGTLGGGLWGAFEFWKDYQTLQSRVENFISPDMSKYDEQIAVLKSEVSMVLEEVSLVNDVATSLKNDLRDDIKTMKTDIRAIDKVVNDIEDRVKANEREISTDFKILEKEIDDKIKKALNNPLAGVK
jgi:septal ring factor EnvC (AmiA/AmiB activator)